MAKILIDVEAQLEEARRDLDRLRDSVGNVGMQIAETGRKVETHNAGLQDLRGAYNLFSTAVGTVTSAVKSVIDPTIEYSKQIRDLGTFAGITAEESSRLIQVTDDLGIDFGTLRTAARNLADEGLQPSVETLAMLADEFVAIKDPVEASQFLMEKFGARAGPQMAYALSQGGDAIRALGEDAEATGLVVGQDFVDQARKAELALDDWEDSVMALKVALAEHLLPAVTDIVSQGADLITWWGVIGGEIMKGNIELGKWNKLAYEVAFTDKTLEQATAEVKESIEDQTYALGELDPFLLRMHEQQQAAAGSAGSLANSESIVAAQLEQTAAAHAEAAVQADILRAAQEEADQAARNATVAYYNLAEQLKETEAAELARASIVLLKDALDAGTITSGEYNAAVREIQLAFELATPQSMALAGAVQNLSEMYADGKITADEYTVALGLVEDAAADGQVELSELGLSVARDVTPPIEDARSTTEDFNDELDYLNGRTVTATVVTNYENHTYNYEPEWRGTQSRQHGGGYGPGALLVGEGGPELLFPRSSGYVMNNADSSRLIGAMEAIAERLGGGNTYNYYGVAGEMDYAYARARAGAT